MADRLAEIRARVEAACVDSRMFAPGTPEDEKRKRALMELVVRAHVDIPFLLSEVTRLTAALEAAEKRAEAGARDVTDLADGAYSICDMCGLYGDCEETTKCPYGAYYDGSSGQSKRTYPDEPCDRFLYKRRGPSAENGGEDDVG